MLRDDLLCFRVVNISVALAVTINRAFFTFVVVLNSSASRADEVILISVLLSTYFLFLLFDVSETSFLYFLHKLIIVVCMIRKLLVSSHKQERLGMIIDTALYQNVLELSLGRYFELRNDLVDLV